MQISQNIFVHKTIVKDPYGDGSIDQLNEYRIDNQSPYDVRIDFDISSSVQARFVNRSFPGGKGGGAHLVQRKASKDGGSGANSANQIRI